MTANNAFVDKDCPDYPARFQLFTTHFGVFSRSLNQNVTYNALYRKDTELRRDQV